MKPSENPSLATDYSDNEPPKGTPAFALGPEGSYNDITRRVLAVLTVSTLGFLYAATFISFLLGLIDYTKFSQALTAMYVPTALSLVVLVFFFKGKAIGKRLRRALKALT